MLMNGNANGPMSLIHKLISSSSLWIPITNHNIKYQIPILSPSIFQNNINNSMKLFNMVFNILFS